MVCWEIFFISDLISVRFIWCIFIVVYYNCIFYLLFLGGIFIWYIYRLFSISKVDVCKLNIVFESKIMDNKLLKVYGN